MPNKVSEMAELTTSFADSGEAIISRKIESLPDTSASDLSTDEFIEYYDVERTVDEIAKGGYRCVRSVLFWSSPLYLDRYCIRLHSSSRMNYWETPCPYSKL